MCLAITEFFKKNRILNIINLIMLSLDKIYKNILKIYI
jgi:hypothetical protein